MPKCGFNKIDLHGCSPVNLLHIFRIPFPRNTSGWLLLNVPILHPLKTVHNQSIRYEMEL